MHACTHARALEEHDDLRLLPSRRSRTGEIHPDSLNELVPTRNLNESLNGLSKDHLALGVLNVVGRLVPTRNLNES